MDPSHALDSSFDEVVGPRPVGRTHAPYPAIHTDFHRTVTEARAPWETTNAD
jgi:hypothetical protein